MNKEQQEKLAKEMGDIIPILRKILYDKANDAFTTDKEKTDFTFGSIVNLLGNLTVEVAHNDPELFVSLFSQTMDNLGEWARIAIDKMHRIKGAH